MSKCPICQKEVEDVAQAHTTEPFVMPATEVMGGLTAWGVYDAAKTILCQDERYVHFKFDGTLHERLVEMVGARDYDAVSEKQRYWQEHPQKCQHDGCKELGTACYLEPFTPDPDEWYCWDHAHEHGYCPCCGRFSAGIDDFDFSKSGLCGDCEETVRDEMGEYDDYDDDYDYDDY